MNDHRIKRAIELVTLGRSIEDKDAVEWINFLVAAAEREGLVDYVLKAEAVTAMKSTEGTLQ